MQISSKLGIIAASLFAICYLSISLFMIIRVRKCLFDCKDRKKLAISISSCFLSITVPISIYHTYEHLAHFVKPKLQSQIVRIIWMVPVYALESMMSIIFYNYSFYFQSLREIYEAYAIYCFMRYLLQFLGDGRTLAARLANKPAMMGFHKSPFCYLSPWSMGVEFLSRCKAGVFQFVLIRFLLTIFSIVLKGCGWFEEGLYTLTSAFLWVMIINCCSQWWALYSLLLFYQSCELELQSIRPVGKMLCIKIVIFFSWWQSIFIGLLVHLGQIKSIVDDHESHTHTAQEIADGVQDLLICMEMLVAAIAFLNSFPISEFYPFPVLPIKKKNIARKEKDKDILIPNNRSLVYNKFIEFSVSIISKHVKDFHIDLQRNFQNNNNNNNSNINSNDENMDATSCSPNHSTKITTFFNDDEQIEDATENIGLLTSFPERGSSQSTTSSSSPHSPLTTSLPCSPLSPIKQLQGPSSYQHYMTLTESPTTYHDVYLGDHTTILSIKEKQDDYFSPHENILNNVIPESTSAPVKLQVTIPKYENDCLLSVQDKDSMPSIKSVSHAKLHTRKPSTTSIDSDSILNSNTTTTTSTSTTTTITSSQQQQQALRKTRSRKSYTSNHSPTQYDVSIHSNNNNNNNDVATHHHHLRNTYDHDPLLYYIEEDEHNPNNNDNDLYISSEASSSSNHPIISKSMWQALWLTSVPGELHEDLTDFSSQVLETYFHSPYHHIRKWVKGANAVS